MVQAHKNFQQLEILVSVLLDNTEHYCFIHIDKKNSELFNQLEWAFRNLSRVHMVSERVTVNWSGFSQVQATLALMRMVKASGIQFERVQLMSGEDFPVKSTTEIETFLAQHRHDEFLAYEEIGSYGWRVLHDNILTENRYNRTLPVRSMQKIYRALQYLLPQRKLLQKWKLYKGSQWFNISMEAMEYCVQFVKENPDFVKVFHSSACADEHFFQIILLNSPFEKHIINNNLYSICWHPSQNSPAYLDVEDLAKAMKKPDVLFARKIDEPTATLLYEKCKS